MLWRTVVKITFRLSSVGVKYGDGLPIAANSAARLEAGGAQRITALYCQCLGSPVNQHRRMRLEHRDRRRRSLPLDC
jgi:hypothetical protein